MGKGNKQKRSVDAQLFEDRRALFFAQRESNKEMLTEIDLLRKMQAKDHEMLLTIWRDLEVKYNHIGKIFDLDVVIPDLIDVNLPGEQSFNAEDNSIQILEELEKLEAADKERYVDMINLSGRLIKNVQIYKNLLIKLKNHEDEIKQEYDAKTYEVKTSIGSKEVMIKVSREEEPGLVDDMALLSLLLAKHAVLPNINEPTMVDAAVGQSDDDYLPRLKTRLQNLEKEGTALDRRLECLQKDRGILLACLDGFRVAQESESEELNIKSQELESGIAQAKEVLQRREVIVDNIMPVVVSDIGQYRDDCSIDQKVGYVGELVRNVVDRQKRNSLLREMLKSLQNRCDDEIKRIRAEIVGLETEGDKTRVELIASVEVLSENCPRSIDVGVDNYCSFVPKSFSKQDDAGSSLKLTQLIDEKERVLTRNRMLLSASLKINEIKTSYDSVNERSIELQNKVNDQTYEAAKELLKLYRHSKRFGDLRFRNKKFYSDEKKVNKEIHKVARKAARRNVFGNLLRSISKNARLRAACQDGLKNASAVRQMAPISTKGCKEQLAHYGDLVAAFKMSREKLLDDHSIRFKVEMSVLNGIDKEINECDAINCLSMSEIFAGAATSYAEMSKRLSVSRVCENADDAVSVVSGVIDVKYSEDKALPSTVASSVDGEDSDTCLKKPNTPSGSAAGTDCGDMNSVSTDSERRVSKKSFLARLFSP
ncbi:MAG: hypothetical protein KAS93_04825, partial [Gammaproteobacteria bacterium]|nr:hypothetical protein [Gammaproteobacteria bacterium]